MKTYYSIYHIIYNDIEEEYRNEYSLYKVNDEGYVPVYSHCHKTYNKLIYRTYNKTEMEIYLNLLGLKWDKDFKLVNDKKHDNREFIIYKTDCI